MRSGRGVALACVLAVGGLMVGGWLTSAQAQEKSKTTPKPLPNTIDVRLIWSFYFQGNKKKGEFIELERLDAKENRGRSLVITHLETRTDQSILFQLVEKRKKPSKGGRRSVWKKTVRRGDPFSADFRTSSSEYVGSRYSSFTGMRFDPDTRPAIELTRSSGEVCVYAEGYWSRP